jgi:hypothetical protein
MNITLAYNDYCKLVATQPSDDVVRANVEPKCIGNGAKGMIASRVSMGVVNRFKMIDIE